MFLSFTHVLVEKPYLMRQVLPQRATGWKSNYSIRLENLSPVSNTK